MKMKEKIYYRSPKIIQECMIYAQSYSQKYKHEIEPDSKLVSVDGYSYKKGSEIINFEIDSMLNYVSSYVPFYKKLVSSAGLSPADINSGNYKNIFPIVSKSEIKKFPEDFVTEISSHKPITIHTSGTTGQPLAVVTNKEDRAKNYWFFNSLLAKYGINYKNRSITIAGKKLSLNGGRASISRHDRYANTLYLSNYDLSVQNVDRYIEAINKFNPVYIDSYPYPLVTIAKRILFLGYENITPNLKLILTSSEALDDKSRDLLSRAFQCKVIDQYGSAEMASFGYSENGAEFYFPGMYSQLEFLEDESGHYEIVATSLIARGMPIIRYATGDKIAKFDINSVGGSVTGKILGRKEDSLVLPDGRVITQFNPISGIPYVSSSQIFQDKNGDVTINVIADPGYTNEQSRRVYELSRMKLGEKLNIRVKLVNKHKLTDGGKFKFICSDYKI